MYCGIPQLSPTSNDASTSREELTHTDVEDNEFWDNLEMQDEEEAPAPPQEEIQSPPPQPRNLWTTLDNFSAHMDTKDLRMDEMCRDQEDMRRDQNVLIKNHDMLFWDVGTHFVVPLDG